MTPPAGRKPRLLFCPAWYPNRFNAGSGEFNRTLARELARHFDVKVLYVHVHEDAAADTRRELEEDEGVTVLRSYVHRWMRIGPLFPLLYLGRFMDGFRRLYADGDRPDLVFARGVLPGGMGAHVLRRRFGIPYVTIDSFSGFAEEMRSPVKRWWTGRILNAATRNAAVSRSHRETMRAVFPDARIEVMTNVIAEKAPAGGDPGDPAKELRILYVGNIVAVKGWDLLLEAVRMHQDRASAPVRLTIVGGGDEAGLRAKIAALSLGASVDVAGRRPHGEIARLIGGHHFLALPSRVDTCPNVVLEALMEGRPVLATRSGGAEDMVNEAMGRLVERESAAALADGIAWMRGHLGEFDAEAIRRHVIEHHSVGALVAFLEGAM